MTHHAPRADLSTHEVANQSEPLVGVNLFDADRMLADAVRRNDGRAHLERLSAFGAAVGSEAVQDQGRLANEAPPRFKPYDRFGRRIDEVEFTPPITP